jgi:uncharacterized membrane protein YsdA (DUF1294 family)
MSGWFLELNTIEQILLSYLLLINIIAFLLFGLDKYKARFGHRRLSERRLLVLALFGGSAGALAAMSIFRHKTKKLSFQAVLALILALQLVATLLILG